MTDEQQLIAEIRTRRRAGIPALGVEMRRRVEVFGAIAIDSDVRREAFSELTAPFELSPYRLIVLDGSRVDPPTETVDLEMALVEFASNGAPQVVGRVERSFRLGEARVHHTLMSITVPYRGRAIAPRLTLAAFDRYDQLGMETVTVHAGLASGRFYWSGKVGFDFHREADRRHVERWATFVLGALGLPIDLDGISRLQQWALLGTTTDPAPTASFEQLATSASRVSTSLLDPNGTGVVGDVDAGQVEVESGMVDLAAHLGRVATANQIDWAAPVPLGKLIMLAGPDWLGRFDLTDPVSRALYASAAQHAIAKALATP